MYRIREVDGHDDDVADALAVLHRLTFFDGASVPDFDQGHWWLAFYEAKPVAFAGVIPSTRVRDAGYFSRVGVLKKHCGHGLQRRLMRAMELRARGNGSHLCLDVRAVELPRFHERLDVAPLLPSRSPCPPAVPTRIGDKANSCSTEVASW